MSKYVNFDPKNAASPERVRISVLKELLEEYADDEEGMKAAIRTRLDDLMPKHIIVDDMLASVNYLTGLACGVGHKGRHRPPGQPSSALRGRAAPEPVPYRLLPYGTSHSGTYDYPGSDIVTPPVLINIRPVTAAIKEFFGSPR